MSVSYALYHALSVPSLNFDFDDMDIPSTHAVKESLPSRTSVDESKPTHLLRGCDLSGPDSVPSRTCAETPVPTSVTRDRDESCVDVPSTQDTSDSVSSRTIVEGSGTTDVSRDRCVSDTDVQSLQDAPNSVDCQTCVEEPRPTDVLRGRGVRVNRHPGNEYFRKIVDEYVNVYAMSTKKQKMEITRSVVDHIRQQLRPPGRFLEKDSTTGYWREVDNKVALEKASQALRDGAAPIRRESANDSWDPIYMDTIFDDEDDVGAKRQQSS